MAAPLPRASAFVDPENSGSDQRRAWAQLPTTQAVAQETRGRIEARLAEVVNAALSSSDGKLASAAGRLAQDLELLGMIARLENGDDFKPALTVVFRKAGK